MGAHLSCLKFRRRRKLSDKSPQQPNEEKKSFEFDEEPVLLTGPEGYGYFPCELGQKLHNERYELKRKLGWGEYSTVWLAIDTLENRYVALKILTFNATQGHNHGKLDEISLMKRISQANPNHPGWQHCAKLQDTFTVQSTHGDHLCLVCEVLGGTVMDLRRAQQTKSFTVPVTKRIVKQTLQALDYLHNECKIIHTDLKSGNLLINLDPEHQHENISQLLTGEPSTSYPPRTVPELSPNPIVTVISQPLPNFGLEPDGNNILVKLADFGHATWIDRHFTEEIQPIALRAPEVILKHPWSTEVDIWALGCLTFEYLTGAWFLNPKAGRTWTLDDQHLERMIEVTGEDFPPDMLAKSERRDELFENGRLRRIHKYWPVTIEDCIRNYKLVDEGEVQAAATFLKRCFRLRPSDRASAVELLNDPWLQGV